MIASRLDLPVVPVKLEDVDRLMPVGSSFVRPGRIRVAFGAPLRLRGDDYAALAAQVEEACEPLIPLAGNLQAITLSRIREFRQCKYARTLHVLTSYGTLVANRAKRCANTERCAQRGK